jgi:hypothetical protein
MRACAFLLAVLNASAQTGSLADACRAGKTKQVEALLAGGAAIETRDPDGRTPLMLAAQYGRIATVQLLLSKGAQPDSRDSRGWDAYMLALFSPAGGVIHTAHDGVLKLLPQPKRIRIALSAAWTPGKPTISCFLRLDELIQHLRVIRPDALALESFQRFAIASGRDLMAIVQFDVLGTSEVPNKTPPEDIDATLFLMVEPGATCGYHADELSMAIHATLTRPNVATPILSRDFGSARTQAAANPNQYGPLYAECAKSQSGPMYWDVVKALLEQH